MRVLGLFEGIGGFALASVWAGLESAQFVEIDPNAQKVLRYHFPNVPIHSDIRTYSPTERYDVLTGGFPCTGTSAAGSKTGLAHAESALFRDMLRVIHECQPKYTVIENPPGVVDRGLRAILGGLRMAGYSSEIIVCSAGRLGAGHIRQRLFVVSYPHCGAGDATVTVTGASEVRNLVQKAQRHARWLQVKPVGDGANNGFSVSLDVRGIKYSIHQGFAQKTGLKGRNTARILAGRAVTPQQALVPLLRVKELEDAKTLHQATNAGSTYATAD